jgi:shikimate kinase
MNPAPHLVLVGPMGAGKTSIGRRLAERLGLPFTDLDHELEARTGSSVGAIFDCEGEAGFRAREAALLEALLASPPMVLATGGGAVLADANRRLMRTRAFVVHLAVRVDSQLQRLARDRARPLLQTDDRTAVLSRLAGERGPLYADVADFVFETDGLAAPEAARLLALAVHARWQRSGVAA